MTKNRKEPYVLLYNVLGFYPKDISLYELALLHKSIIKKNENGKRVNNERLEFLGDAIIEAVISDLLYKKFENKSEGFLTNVRSKIVKRETLNKLAVDMGLDKLVTASGQVNHSHNNNIYGNAFEAFIGAIYLDQGYNKCKTFFEEKIFNVCIDLKKIVELDENFKSKLLEWSQKNRANLSFNLLQEGYDKNHNQYFKSEVTINGIVAGVGEGYSKKESQQNASKQALFKVIKNRKLFLNNNQENNQSKNSNETTDTVE